MAAQDSIVGEIQLKGMRKFIAERMVESKRNCPHVPLFCEVDMTNLQIMQEQINGNLQTGQKKVSLTSMILTSVGRALHEYPRINARLEGDRIVLLKEVNIGVAVALEEGLLVPVIKNVDQKPLKEINEEMGDYIVKARTKKLSPDHFTGGTFTVSNLGMYDITAFVPIINPPETAILGVGKVVNRPVVIENAVVIRPMLWLTLAFDHRVIDGAPAAQFLSHLKGLIEHQA